MTRKGQKRCLMRRGYPRGADGIRFKTNLMIDPTNTFWINIDYTQLAAAYWAQIGVDVEIDQRRGLSRFHGTLA